MPSALEAPFRMVATDGRAFGGGMITMGGSDTQRNAEKTASLASAAHDLPCAPERVTLVDVIEEDSRTYVIDGCGVPNRQRVGMRVPLALALLDGEEALTSR
jgi:hypothetical protein